MLVSEGMITELQSHWQVLRPLLVIHSEDHSEDEYEQAVEHMNQLIDEAGTDESHPLYELLDTLGTLIHAYEEEHYQIQALAQRFGVAPSVFFEAPT